MTGPSAGGPVAPRRVAVYPGSFDPFTNGHLDVLQRAARLFDRLVVGVLVHPTKRCTFAPEQRVDMIRAVVMGLQHPGIEVAQFDGLLVDFCRRVGACAVIRGLRAVSDYEYEMQLAHINKKLAPDIEAIFLMTSTQHSFLSSSIVKEVARLSDDVADQVPPTVHDALRQLFPRG